VILGLALGVLFSNGTAARVEVRHAGAPIPVEIVAINKDNQELSVDALPSRLIVGHNRQRIVRIKIPSNATAICAAFSTQSGRFRSCSAQLDMRSGSARNGTRPQRFPSILRRALDALPGERTELQLQLQLPGMKQIHG